MPLKHGEKTHNACNNCNKLANFHITATYKYGKLLTFIRQNKKSKKAPWKKFSRLWRKAGFTFNRTHHDLSEKKRGGGRLIGFLKPVLSLLSFRYRPTRLIKCLHSIWMSQWTLSHYFWTKVWCKTCWLSAILTLAKLLLLAKAAYIFSPTLPAPLRSLRVDRWHLLLAFITYINKIITIWVTWSLLSMCGLTVPPLHPWWCQWG